MALAVGGVTVTADGFGFPANARLDFVVGLPRPPFNSSCLHLSPSVPPGVVAWRGGWMDLRVAFRHPGPGVRPSWRWRLTRGTATVGPHVESGLRGASRPRGEGIGRVSGTGVVGDDRLMC